MEMVKLRTDTIFKPQRRKEQANSQWMQREIAAGDFETKDGFPHIYSWSMWNGSQYDDFHQVWGGTVTNPQMLLEANNGIEYPPFTIVNFLKLHFETGHYSQGGNGKRNTPPQMYFFNLRYDAQSIIKTMPDDVIEVLYHSNDVMVDTWNWSVASDVKQLKIDNPFKGELNSKGKPDKRKSIKVWATINPDDEEDWEYADKGRYVRVAYLSKKFLSLEPIKFYTEGVKWVKVQCWDIAQFCGGGSLDYNAKKHLGEGKLDFSKDEMVLMGSLTPEGIAFSVNNWQKITDYAEKDSNLTARLAWKIVRSFENNNVRMVKPFSSAAVSERAFLDRCEIPTMNDMMKVRPDVANAFWTGYQGGWFSATGAGLWPNAHAEDITSAYPHVLWWCVDHTDGFWIGTFSGDDEEEWSDYISKHIMYRPAIFEAEVIFPEGLNIYPSSKKSEEFGCLINARINYGWFTGDEIVEFQKWGAEITVERWAAFIPNGECEPAPDVEDGIRYPYRLGIEGFYSAKMEQDRLKKAGDPAYDAERRDIEKLCLNGIYGKQAAAQKKTDGLRHTGNLWNPINAAVITGGCRMRMAEIIRLNNYEGVLSVATDGIIFDGALNLIVPENPKPVYFDGVLNDLGDWAKDGDGALLLLMSGVYSLIMSLPDGGVQVKKTYRGTYSLFLDYRDENGDLVMDLYGENHLDFCHRYENSTHVSRDEENNPFYRPYSLGEAKMKKDFSKTNIFRIVPLTITACGDSNKRKWNTKPETFGDLAQRWWPSGTWETMI